jgi:hypothetical protein
MQFNFGCLLIVRLNCSKGKVPKLFRILKHVFVVCLIYSTIEWYVCPTSFFKFSKSAETLLQFMQDILQSYTCWKKVSRHSSLFACKHFCKTFCMPHSTLTANARDKRKEEKANSCNFCAYHVARAAAMEATRQPRNNYSTPHNITQCSKK